jgi:hypothetical protein
MGAFGVSANKGAASVKSVLLLTAAASTPRRGKIVEFTIGSDTTPADAAFVVIGQRCSTAGTGTTVTPNACDPADPIASTIVATGTVTVDPTLTASAFVFPGFALNQRASFRWVAVPGYEIIIPATAANGVAFGVSAATTTSFQAGSMFTD